MNNLLTKVTDKVKVNGDNSFLNPYSYLLLRKLNYEVDNIDNYMIDGQLMIKLLKFLGVANLKRKSFDLSSLALDIFSEAEKTGDKMYFLGTTEDNITIAVEKIKNKFPLLNITGFHHGYFTSNDMLERVLDDVIISNVNTVIVGTGTPNQEKILIKLRAKGFKGTGFTCGGFFHQTANKINYYPAWINKYHLRWLYRIYDEPKLAKRYFLIYPYAILKLFWDVKIINKQ
jgi:N-acetylglucosaminyldiphosphoundecaprenol N-acetyl-beta-D-mannosaminyltransferase